MSNSVRCALTSLFICLSLSVRAQSTRVDIYSAQQLSASSPAGAKTTPQADVSTDILQHYPNHYTMYVVRHADGQSEWHRSMADAFFVLEGKAQLCSGGTMVGAKETAPGERRGSGISGASCVLVKTGDIVHIPASVPHQVRMTSGETLAYFVLKISEEAAEPHMPVRKSTSGSTRY